MSAINEADKPTFVAAGALAAGLLVVILALAWIG
jgi:hypothetical protein